MGIKNLATVLTRHGGAGLYKQGSLSDYAGLTVAVDASVYMYKYKSMHGLNWLTVFQSFLNSLDGIKCVFVFDSKTCIQEKIAERLKRSSRKKALNDRVSQVEAALREYKNGGAIAECLAQFVVRNRVARLTGKDAVDLYRVEEYLSKAKNQLLPIYSSDFDNVRKMCAAMGMATIDATIEAEKLCAMLCIEQKVDAIMTEDSDAYAYLSPRILSKVSSGKCVESSAPAILAALGLTPAQFIDVCILCGSDYSSTIPGIGPMKAYKYIKMYGNIENMGQSLKLDVGVVNHARLREIFARVESGIDALVFPAKTHDEPLRSLLPPCAVE